jgi:hypothetical protein
MNFIPSSSGDTIIFGFSSNNEINFSESLTATFVYEGATLVDSVFGDVPADWKEGNVDITQLTLGTSVTNIGSSAFNGCVSLIGSLVIPNRVTSIGSNAFLYCVSLTGNLTIPNRVTSIGIYAFGYCASFTGSLNIGSSVTSIGNNAFRGCNGFTNSLAIPNSVTTIDSEAFIDCTGFTGSLTIPNSATTIGSTAFENCTGLTNAYLNQPLSAVGSNAFINSGLTTISLRPSPNTPAGWTIGSGQTIGGKSGITVVANWTTYPNPP